MLMNSFTLTMEMCSIAGMFALVLNKDHLLLSLLSLESIMLSLVVVVPTSLLMSSAETMIFTIMLLSIGACEASLGLALMVLMSRTYGSDKIKSLSLNKC